AARRHPGRADRHFLLRAMTLMVFARARRGLHTAALGLLVLAPSLAGPAALVLTALASLAVPPAPGQSTLSAFADDVDHSSRHARASVVTVIAQGDLSKPGQPRRTHSRAGTGVAVSANGVLTTASVVLGADRVFVVTDNHLQVEARVAGMDPVRNL